MVYAKKMKVNLLAEGLNLTPIKNTVRDYPNEFHYFTFANKETVDSLKQVQMHEEKRRSLEERDLDFSNFPLLKTRMGDYCAVSEELETALNSESISLKNAADLFVESLLCVNTTMIFLTTVEVYDRRFSQDIHAETGDNSFPEANEEPREYKSVKVMLKKETQGKQVLKKLIIGTRIFNILVHNMFYCISSCMYELCCCRAVMPRNT